MGSEMCIRDRTLTFECVVTKPKDDETETDEPRTIKGAVKIPEASRDTVDDDDMSFVVDVEDRAPERRSIEDAAVTALNNSLKPVLREAFVTIDAELRLRAES